MFLAFHKAYLFIYLIKKSLLHQSYRLGSIWALRDNNKRFLSLSIYVKGEMPPIRVRGPLLPSHALHSLFVQYL